MEALGSTMMSFKWMPSKSSLKNFSPAKVTSIQVKGQKHGPIHAVLMDPTNLNDCSQFGGTAMPLSMAAAKAATSSVSMEEVLSLHTSMLKKAQDKERQQKEQIPLHQLRQGGFAEDSLMYRQIFVVRSYEVGPDKCTSMREIFSLFQEMALNHVQLLGIAGDGFGATQAMNRFGLIWVVTKMQVDVERYPVWPEVIEIDSWVASAGKNGMRRDWIMRSFHTGEVLARATSTWCIMHATTRRLAKIPPDVRAEIEPNFMDHRSAYSQVESMQPAGASSRIPKLDDDSTEHRISHLTSTPADLDMNQHVNNLKYINWVLESIPLEHMRTHKLTSIVLEYRRECHSSDVVESLTSAKTVVNGGDEEARIRCCEYAHLLRMQDAGRQEILRGKTTWRAREHAI